ncbi:hypothetical protein K7432_013555 [Basidiobolus ranarum]|uniref:Uncharacterized protein n=1 Tax=Basidiobolus ranarum TaxID=34480 RepID=A0ABR2VRB6_9FUNG
MRLLTYVTLVIVIGSSFADRNPNPVTNIFEAFGYFKKVVGTVESELDRALSSDCISLAANFKEAGLTKIA